MSRQHEPHGKRKSRIQHSRTKQRRQLHVETLESRQLMAANLTAALVDDVLHGGAGNDTLDGGAGDDKLDGAEGNDRIRGGEGADRLNGQSGTDLLVGNACVDALIADAEDFAIEGDDVLQELAPSLRYDGTSPLVQILPYNGDC